MRMQKYEKACVKKIVFGILVHVLKKMLNI